MEYHNSPQVLLDRLDRLLAEVPASPPYGEDLNDPDYAVQHEQCHQVDNKSLFCLIWMCLGSLARQTLAPLE